MFGSPETTTGGNALKFYASVRLDIRRIGAIKEAGAAGKDMTVVGNRTRVKVVKNKMAPPFREVEFDILYGQGISRSGDVVDLASDASIVQKSGAWFSFDGERIGQGRENARTYLEQHPELDGATRDEARFTTGHRAAGVARSGEYRRNGLQAGQKRGSAQPGGARQGRDRTERRAARPPAPVSPAEELSGLWAAPVTAGDKVPQFPPSIAGGRSGNELAGRALTLPVGGLGGGE